MTQPATQLERVSALALKLEDPTCTSDDALSCLGAIAALKRRVKELDEAIKAAAIAWIKEHGPLVCGDVKYLVGKKKRVKCTSNAGVLEALLPIVQGDLAKLAEYLASDAWKQGACRKVLPAETPLFAETIVESLDGKGDVEELVQFDTRFQRRVEREESDD